jgi:hypothetical protein
VRPRAVAATIVGDDGLAFREFMLENGALGDCRVVAALFGKRASG